MQISLIEAVRAVAFFGAVSLILFTIYAFAGN